MLAGATGLFVINSQAKPLPQALHPAVPAATLSGQATLTFWGFQVYHATLWVTPGFAGNTYEHSPFALELAYLRDFKGADIAQRSIAEMLRQSPLPQAQAAAWANQMRDLFPDVKVGDRLTGVNHPGIGAVFWSNDRLLGAVRDPVFAKYFFGIWLSPKTSEPQLRQALLAQAKAVVPAGAAP